MSPTAFAPCAVVGSIPRAAQERTLEQEVQSSQTTLGLGPIVLPSRRGSLAEAFGSELAWQSHLLQDASLLEAILGRPIDNLESAPYVAGLRPDLELDVDGYQVLVELQLGPADPRHLGQVLRYQRGGGADAVLWLAEEARHDYASHVNDLNRLGGARVALAEVSALKVAGGWTFAGRVVAGELLGAPEAQDELAPPSDRQILYERFWEALFRHAADQQLHLFHGNRPTRQPWLLKPWRAGSGIYYRVHLAAGKTRVALVVKARAPLYGEEVYAALEAQQDNINAALSDGDLLWESAENGGRIEATVRGGYAAETERSIEVTVSLLQQMQRLFNPLLSSLPLNLLSQAADDPQTALF